VSFASNLSRRARTEAKITVRRHVKVPTHGWIVSADLEESDRFQSRPGA